MASSAWATMTIIVEEDFCAFAAVVCAAVNGNTLTISAAEKKLSWRISSLAMQQDALGASSLEQIQYIGQQS